jgi:SAM-dependent methyltransferase
MAAGDARSITAERDRTLALVQGEKTMVALSPEEVRHLDLRLVDAWGIQFPSDANSVEELLAGALDRTAVDRFIKARGEASDALTRGDGHSTLSIEANLFDAMVHADIFGPITSLRRHLILDGICTALGLVQRLGLDGDTLDVGCHAGFVGSLLAEALGRPATGIDPSSAAIAFGRSYRGRSPMLNLVEAAIPWDTSARFDLAIAIDAMPQEAAKMGPYLRGLSELLNPAGIAVVVSSYWKNADVEVTRRQLRQARLGFGYADVVGGYGNVPRDDGQRRTGASGRQTVGIDRTGEYSLTRCSQKGAALAAPLSSVRFLCRQFAYQPSTAMHPIINRLGLKLALDNSVTSRRVRNANRPGLSRKSGDPEKSAGANRPW